MAFCKYINNNNCIAKLAEQARLVVGDNDFVACYVYDYGFMDENGRPNNSYDQFLHGRRIEIDHVIMAKVGKKNEGFIFGRLC